MNSTNKLCKLKQTSTNKWYKHKEGIYAKQSLTDNHKECIHEKKHRPINNTSIKKVYTQKQTLTNKLYKHKEGKHAKKNLDQ